MAVIRKVDINNGINVPKLYWMEINVNPGDEIEIKLNQQNNKIELTKKENNN